MKRVGIAGFLHESNTFLAAKTEYDDFVRASLTTGKDLLDRWSGAHHEIGGFLRAAAEYGFDPVPLLATFAVPSGTISADAFERIALEMLSAIKKSLPLDGLLLALHGATVCETHPDADGEILRRIRALTGSEMPIVTTLDLHANVSREMVDRSTATIVYRSNPHLDQEDRGREAGALMARILRGEVHPVQALETPPMLMRISRQYTAEMPARGLYADIEEVLGWPGILSASAAMGFYYADVQEMGASFLAVAEGDAGLARRAAQWLAGRAFQRRHEFAVDLPDAQAAVRVAAAASKGPVVVMDIGDNVGGGSPGDSTILFHEVLRQQAPDALVILYDPESVQACIAAGPGAAVTLRAGGKTDTLHGAPIELTGCVRLLSDGKFIEYQVRHGGWGKCDQGLTAVVETPHGHTVVLTSRRMAPLSLEQILSLGIHPEKKKILIVKGVVAPRAAYGPIAADVILADTPGVTADDPRRFEYGRRRVPLFPLEEEAEYDRLNVL